MELVSVVIPTYARNDMLERAIQSVLNQTYSNIEILVIDDNDEMSEHRKRTEQIMRQYQENENVRYIQNPQNLGGAKARNIGITESKGKFVAFLDDDDEYLPENIEKKIYVFRKNNSEMLALVYGYVEAITDEGRSVVYRHTFDGNCTYEQLLHNCIAATSQWVCRKDSLLKVGMFADVPCKQDSILMLKLLEHGFEIDYAPQILTKYYDYAGDRISTNGKTILGEIQYRNLGRKLYDTLSTQQILEIEYSFANRLMHLYVEKKEYKNARKELEVMYKINFFRSVRVTVWSFIRQVKRKFF
ncbi:glycosyltransferase family 2 protein [Actinomycetes bacterium NPDC127524]